MTMPEDPFAPEQEAPDPFAEQRPTDPYAIDPVTLPSGVKVTFRSLLSLTADNLRWLRGADDRDGQIAFYNETQARGIDLLVDTWTLTEPSGRPVPTPREVRDLGKRRGYLKIMNAFDLKALENHLEPYRDKLFAKPDTEGE